MNWVLRGSTYERLLLTHLLVLKEMVCFTCLSASLEAPESEVIEVIEFA